MRERDSERARGRKRGSPSISPLVPKDNKQEGDRSIHLFLAQGEQGRGRGSEKEREREGDEERQGERERERGRGGREREREREPRAKTT